MGNNRFDYEKYITETILPTVDKYMFQLYTPEVQSRLDHEIETFKHAIHHGGGRSPDQINYDGESLILRWGNNDRLLYRFQDKSGIVYHIMSEDDPVTISQQEFYREVDSLNFHELCNNRNRADATPDKRGELFIRWTEMEPVSVIGAAVQNDLSQCSIEELKEIIEQFHYDCNKQEDINRAVYEALQMKFRKLRKETVDYFNSLLWEKRSQPPVAKYDPPGITSWEVISQSSDNKDDGEL